jgi:RNA-splicing ligase RtcB
MPDVHASRGCVIGTSMSFKDKIAPSLIGVDIGCGMSAIKLRHARMDAVKLDKLIREKIPAGALKRRTAHRFADEAGIEEMLCASFIRKDMATLCVGTLGGGNHFIEVDKSDDGSLWLIIHSGSRHLGAEVAAYYQDMAHRACGDIAYEHAFLEGEQMRAYLHDVAIAQRFAQINRKAIADEIMRGMKWDTEYSFECVHNYIDTELNILRKGAVSARDGEDVIIPLNMRDGCLICKGKGNGEWNFSAPHGAGRMMSRADARGSLTLSQYKKEMKGIYTTSVSRETIDESPMAYKPMEKIISQISPTVDIVERLKPVYNFKPGEKE